VACEPPDPVLCEPPDPVAPPLAVDPPLLEPPLPGEPPDTDDEPPLPGEPPEPPPTAVSPVAQPSVTLRDPMREIPTTQIESRRMACGCPEHVWNSSRRAPPDDSAQPKGQAGRHPDLRSSTRTVTNAAPNSISRAALHRIRRLSAAISGASSADVRSAHRNSARKNRVEPNTVNHGRRGCGGNAARVAGGRAAITRAWSGT
jgi:hypothetical protein